MLYSRRYDGVEDDPDFAARGVTPMRAEDWFEPFNEDPERRLPPFLVEGNVADEN